MKIITISGVDGSGKSTQIKLLRNHLETEGKKVHYFHAIAFGLAAKISEFRKKYCLICKLSGKCRTGNSGTGESVTKATICQILLRKIFLRIDVFRFKRLAKNLERSGCDYLLTDRYFYDSVVNIEYLSKKNYPAAFIPKPDLAFFMDIAPESIMRRSRKPDQGIAYLKDKTAIFKSKLSGWEMKSIDADRAMDIISEEIKKYVD